MPSRVRPITPEDLYQLKQLFDCQLSPDGRFVATLMQQVNRDENKAYTNICLQPAAGGPLRTFTRGEWADTHPRFSPDGRYLAFISNRSEKAQLWLMFTDGGEAWQLTKLDGGVSSFAWSPDSRSICFTYNATDPEALDREKLQKQGKKNQEQPVVRHVTRLRYRLDGMGFHQQASTELRMVDVTTGKERVLVSDGKDNGDVCFSPDGKWVIFASNKSVDPDTEFMRTDLWRVPADGKGKVERIPTFDGPSSQPSVSPDGQWIAFRGSSSAKLGWAEVYDWLWVIPFNGGKPRQLGAALDRTPTGDALNDTWGSAATLPPVWAPDSTAVYSSVANDGSVELWRFAIKGDSAEAVFDDPGVILGFAIDFERRQLYANFSDVVTPGDLCRRALEGGPLKRLTNVNRDMFARRDLGQVKEVWAKAKAGHRIQGWVFLPPDFNEKRRYPGILYIHGGPHTNYSRAYFHEFQYLAGQGYVVFICNPRGGTGYGLQYKTAIARAWGGADYEDLMTYTDYVLREHPFIDKARLGVAGGSYGGYMTNWIIGHNRRFAAAVSDRCVSNFISFFGSSDVGYIFHKGMGIEAPHVWADLDRFVEMSPISHLAKAKTPTLVIHQENDLRCPIEQGEQVYVLLKTVGVETELLRYPQESHGMSRGGRTDRRIHRLEAIRGWFDKHLKQ